MAKSSFDADDIDYVPHSVRGFLTNVSQLSLITQKYNKCIACSEFVYDQYEKDGFDFLLKVFNSNRYLEEITGLSQLQSDTEKLEVSAPFLHFQTKRVRNRSTFEKGFGIEIVMLTNKNR